MHFICRAFFCLTSLLGTRLRWFIVAVIGCLLSGYNLYAYIQAAKGTLSLKVSSVDANTVMSLFTFIPKSVTKKAVEYVEIIVSYA